MMASSTATPGASTLERVPMGAVDLKANGQKFLRNGLIVSAAIHLGIIGAYLVSQLIQPEDEAAYTGRVIRMETLPPPPPLSSAPPPPVLPQTADIIKPSIGIPTPVPDAQAPEQTIMTQQELSQSFTPVGFGAGNARDTLIIADDLPSQGEFVYYEDEPVPVTTVKPRYPDFAREAQIQGKVILHVLVGKDGRVKNVKVKRSITGLDESAVSAVKQWVFKPALSNNKPVAVWVEVPVDFHF
jgi:protein TonB